MMTKKEFFKSIFEELLDGEFRDLLETISLFMKEHGIRKTTSSD
jgi:hypothetical protein